MHMGDLLFNRAHPNIDRAQGARVDNWIKVFEALKGFEDNVSPNARLTLALILAGASGLLAQAPPPVTPLTTANSAGSGPHHRRSGRLQRRLRRVAWRPVGTRR